MQLTPELKEFLDRANFAHLCTLRADGGPKSDPVWIGREGDRLLVGTGEATPKCQNTYRDPRVALSVVDMQNPYEVAQMRGRVVEHRNDSDLVIMDAIAVKYTGQPFPWRSPEGRVALVIEIEHARLNKLPFQHNPQVG